jgi:hypothetical protein
MMFSKISTRSEGWNQYMHDLYVIKRFFCFEVDVSLVLWHIRGALSKIIGWWKRIVEVLLGRSPSSSLGTSLAWYVNRHFVCAS